MYVTKIHSIFFVYLFLFIDVYCTYSQACLRRFDFALAFIYFYLFFALPALSGSRSRTQ